jgi:hypothetical protein
LTAYAALVGTNHLKPFRVEFTYTEEGYSVIVAESVALAKAGILTLLQKRVKNPVITAVSAEEEEEQLELPFPTPNSLN